ncbi:MAG: hypothetical protein L6Q33_04175 [Bacteriovoracaceae bacterium]|nr:hypothetical protein [Bacteriovoracaceae bacterium]
MNSVKRSPKGHSYTLSQMKGNLALILKKLNLKAPAKFSTSDLQILHWSLLSGLSFDEMTEESQKIINQIIPEHKNELSKSFSSSIMSEFDVPFIDEVNIFKNRLQKIGNNYEELRKFIDRSSTSKTSTETPWSKMSDNIYARFITEGSFGDIGFIQVKVLPETGRIINSLGPTKYRFEITSLVANPNNSDIQPLSFTPLIGMTGVIGTNQITTDPRAAALLVALSLAIRPLQWDDFLSLDNLLKNVRDLNVQNEFEKGWKVLQEEHNDLEKPLKEAGVISGKDKKYSNKKDKIREYRKPGGVNQLDKDFEKMPGKQSRAQDGTETKELSDGTMIIKRPTGSKNGPTLEIQPSKSDPRYPSNGIRIKVRYP